MGISIVNELRIEKLVYGGDALARVDGRVALVPLALPGERVRVEVDSEKKELLRARVTGVEEASPERVEARCPYFGRCGGCQYQHARYPYQVPQKIEILREVFARVGKIAALPEVGAVSGPEWGYRNRIQLHADGQRLGFHGAGSHQLHAIDQCPVASPRLNEAIAVLRRMSRDRRWPRFLRSLELFTNETKVQVNVLDSGAARLSRSFFEWCNQELEGALDTALDYECGAGGVFRVSHKSFFQVNRFLIDPLVDAALEGAAGGAAALDLYAGVGLFSLPLAARFGEVTAVEAVSSAIADLEHNAARTGAKIRAVKARSEDYLAQLDRAPDFVLADPPRAGLGKPAVETLARLRPPRLTIVSCDPPTLARDCSGLLAAGFAIEAVTMIDLFPHTSHIEAVVRLRHAG